MRFPRSFLLLLSTAVLVARAAGNDYDYSGRFVSDDDVVSEFFNVSSPSTVTVFSSSWISATPVGNPVFGFDPILAVWDGSGALINELDDSGVSSPQFEFSNGVKHTYGEFDSYFSLTLGAGTYRATIAQYANYAVEPNFSDGFKGSGKTNFDGRNPDWEFHVLVHPLPPAVPDSGSAAASLLLGLAVVAGLRARAAKR